MQLFLIYGRRTFAILCAMVDSVDTAPYRQLFPVRVPHHPAVGRSAFAANHYIAEGVLTGIPSLFRKCLVTALLYCVSLGELLLGAVVGISVDYSGMAVVQNVFVFLAVVLNALMGDAVESIAFLQDRVTNIFLVF